MEAILDILITIQRLDDKLKDTKSEIEVIPSKIERLEKEIKEANEALNEKTSRIEEIRKIYRMKEGDVAENENKITKLNNQTFAVKTNEEYRAILNEVDFFKKENEKIEDAMINLLEEEEKLKGSIAQHEAETKDFTEKKSTEIENIREHNEQLTEYLAQLNADFETNSGKLPAETKELYNKTRKFRGNAVCLIHDETCTGCYANLTPQFLNELKKRDSLLLCDSCGRILVYVDTKKDI
ncbi:MAG: C4-type zinc ribbon domain-containing protein [bacterium]